MGFELTAAIIAVIAFAIGFAARRSYERRETQNMATQLALDVKELRKRFALRRLSEELIRFRPKSGST
jgi:hypothetical protein